MFTVTVTADDIKAARSGAGCPIHLAVARKGYDRVWVGYHSVWAKDEGVDYQWNLPTSARWFVYDFDAGIKVYPLTFKARRV